MVNVPREGAIFLSNSDKVAPKDTRALQREISVKIDNLVKVKDIANIVPGDTLMSRSGTQREIREKLGEYKFGCHTTKKFAGSSALDNCFRLDSGTNAENMSKADLLQKNPGDVVYGPHNEKMVIDQILSYGEIPYGIVVTFEEEVTLNPEGNRWLQKIIKKDTTSE